MMIFLSVTVFLSALYSVSGLSYDFMGKNQRWNILAMGRELMADITLKAKQTLDIQREHGRFMSFEVGFIMGQIREKYKMMMELYRLSMVHFTKPLYWSPPKIDYHGYSVFYFRKQEMILLLSLEIDRLVEVLEKTNIDVVPFQQYMEGYVLRMKGEQEDSEEKKQRLLEEAVKRRYREEYLKKKLSSGQSIANKTFVSKWPVPGALSLETY